MINYGLSLTAYIKEQLVLWNGWVMNLLLLKSHKELDNVDS
jgi:hypothetical protein